MSRLAAGGAIDRSAPVRFTFDGVTLQGFAGDTLASALVANDVRLVGRSFKYHRPRGLLTAGPEEPNGLVELGVGARREPNTKATTVELYDGLAAASQNRWPSLAFDVLSVNSLLSPILVGGFYYKTFMWPASFWEKVYEPAIRRAAGLGRAAMEPDPDAYDKAHAFCELLVIGAGPAGLAAALTAARSGARVIVCEDDFRLGGRLLSERQTVDGQPGAAWAADVETELRSCPNVRLLSRTQVFGVYDGGVHGAVQRLTDHLPPSPGTPRQRLWKIHARRTVLAAGAVERPLVFGGNDTPGVMMASAVRTYLNRFAAAPGKRAAVFTTTDDGWRTAVDLQAAGVEVVAVIDPRAHPGPIAKAVEAGGAAILAGAVVTDAIGGRSLKRITTSKESFDVDLLAVSGGWNPQVALSTHLGGKPHWSEAHAAFLPGTPPPEMSVAGSAGGQMTLAECLAGGTAAALAALADLGLKGSPATFDAAAEPCGGHALWRVPDGRRKAFVDFQNDVTDKDVEIAAREGFHSVEHLKRYTTLGMATDQGKTSNLNGHALIAELTGRTMTQAGTTVSRPPHLPVAIGAFAGGHRGQHFRPARITAGDAWAREQGARFIDAGQWKRPQWFARPGETDWLQTVDREVDAVRGGVGVCDVSTLGKIEIHGPDAAALLDRVYINTFSTLPVGKTRYGVMLREDGLVMDDGTTARLGEARYLMSTTTANAGRVMQHLEYCCQVLWPELDVQIASVTEQWAQFAVAGPRSRTLLQALLGDRIDLSNAAFPYMAAAELTVGEFPLRLFRLSFSGELAFEIAGPASCGDSLLRAVMAAGESLGVQPYGAEALGVMRIEKGHVGGAELNGQTTASDLGLGRMMSSKKDYIGRAMAERPGLTDAGRPVLVGVRPVDPTQRLRSGAHFLPVGAAASAANDLGYLTSTAYSPSIASWIGLGLLKGGAERVGERVRAYDPVRNGDVEVEVCSPIFIDPEGARLRA